MGWCRTRDKWTKISGIYRPCNKDQKSCCWGIKGKFPNICEDKRDSWLNYLRLIMSICKLIFTIERIIFTYFRETQGSCCHVWILRRETPLSPTMLKYENSFYLLGIYKDWAERVYVLQTLENTMSTEAGIAWRKVNHSARKNCHYRLSSWRSSTHFDSTSGSEI